MSNHSREEAGEHRYQAGSPCCKTSESCSKQEISHANEHSVNSTGFCSCSHSPSQQPCEVQRGIQGQLSLNSLAGMPADASDIPVPPHPRGVIPNGRLLSGRLWACWGKVGSQVSMTHFPPPEIIYWGWDSLGNWEPGLLPIEWGAPEPQVPPSSHSELWSCHPLWDYRCFQFCLFIKGLRTRGL